MTNITQDNNVDLFESLAQIRQQENEKISGMSEEEFVDYLTKQYETVLEDAEKNGIKTIFVGGQDSDE